MSNEETAIMTQTIENEQSLPSIQTANLMQNTQLMNSIYKLAKMYSTSTMIPATYQNRPDNCFVACELACRMNVSPILVMQQLYVVKGKPAWSGQACIALINGCGKFVRELEFVFVGEQGNNSYGCYCQTARKIDNHELIGTKITIQMAIDEGWMNKDGSKWKTMPSQMLMYRAAAFFARVYCPEVLMGFNLASEIEDIAKEEKPKTIIAID